VYYSRQQCLIQQKPRPCEQIVAWAGSKAAAPGNSLRRLEGCFV